MGAARPAPQPRLSVLTVEHQPERADLRTRTGAENGEASVLFRVSLDDVTFGQCSRESFTGRFNVTRSWTVRASELRGKGRARSA